MKQTTSGNDADDEEAFMHLMKMKNPDLIYEVFKDRPEALLRLYTFTYVKGATTEQQSETVRFMDANPGIAFGILRYAFPDIINRIMWLKMDTLYPPHVFHGDRALSMAYYAIVDPYERFDRSFIEPDLLAACVEDESLARLVCTQFQAIRPGQLPPAAYCFLSTFLASRLYRVFTHSIQFNDYTSFLLLEENFQHRMYEELYTHISLQNVCDVLHEMAQADKEETMEIDLGEGPMAKHHIGVRLYKDETYEEFWDRDRQSDSLLSSLKFGVNGGAIVSIHFPESEPRTVAEIRQEQIQLRRPLGGLDPLWANPEWQVLTLDNLAERIKWFLKENKTRGSLGNATSIPASTVRSLEFLLKQTREAAERTRFSDPRLNESFSDSEMNDLFENFFRDKWTWWRILFTKVQVVKRSGGLTQVGIARPRAGEKHNNGRRVYQCRVCGEETTRVDLESALPFCNDECFSRY